MQEVPICAKLLLRNVTILLIILEAQWPQLQSGSHWEVVCCSRGVDLVRIECVPDDEVDIASTVLGLRLRVGQSGFVFTSGGIGATHDDVTYSAIASAFGQHPPDRCTRSRTP